MELFGDQCQRSGPALRFQCEWSERRWRYLLVNAFVHVLFTLVGPFHFESLDERLDRDALQMTRKETDFND